MSEKQRILGECLKRIKRAEQKGQQNKVANERAFYNYVERTYNDDMTAKDPYNKPENVVEGKEVRIGEDKDHD